MDIRRSPGEEGILCIGGSDNHELFVFDASKGEKRWTFEFLNNNFSKPLIYEDYLLFTTGDAYNVFGNGNNRGYLYALNKDDGTIHQFQQIGGNLSPNPFSDSTAISYRTNRKIELGVQIKSIAEEPLRELSRGQRVPGEYTIYRDGKDSSGKKVEDGYYFVEGFDGCC